MLIPTSLYETVLMVLQGALEELMILKDLAPDEANVHFLLGRLYKSLHDKTSAIKHLTIALNLDPKVSKQSVYHDVAC